MEQVLEWCGGKGFCGNTVSVLVDYAHVAGGAAQPALLATRDPEPSLAWFAEAGVQPRPTCWLGPGIAAPGPWWGRPPFLPPPPLPGQSLVYGDCFIP